MINLSSIIYPSIHLSIIYLSSIYIRISQLISDEKSNVHKISSLFEHNYKTPYEIDLTIFASDIFLKTTFNSLPLQRGLTWRYTNPWRRFLGTWQKREKEKGGEKGHRYFYLWCCIFSCFPKVVLVVSSVFQQHVCNFFSINFPCIQVTYIIFEFVHWSESFIRDIQTLFISISRPRKVHAGVHCDLLTDNFCPPIFVWAKQFSVLDGNKE